MGQQVRARPGPRHPRRRRAAATGHRGQGAVGRGAGQGGGGRFGGGALGQIFGPGTVPAVDGGKLTLQTRAGDVEITVPADVRVTRSTAGTTADLTQGSTVVVTSSTDADGNRTAQTVFVVSR